MTMPPGPAANAPADRSALPGVVILGGAHNALALARSFGRKGIPVALVTDDHPLPTFSRYVSCRFDWPGATATGAAAWLVTLANQHGFKNWLLLPCADNEVRLVAENQDLLRTRFQTMGTQWQSLQHLCNKQLLAQTAERAGVAVPKSYPVASADDATRIDVTFPVILKPAMRMTRNEFTSAKAWRADTRNQLVALYRKATVLQGQDGVIVQEYIPGGGEAQFSYAALWSNNFPVAELAARRTRQYPVEFGYTSTFVEIVDNDEVKNISRKLLSSVGFEGLVEVEYKHDARSNSYKILDVNPRSWSWLSLCEAGGLDFPELILNLGVAPALQASTGHAWVHAPRDIVASIHLLLFNRMGVVAWLQSYRQKLAFAVFAWDDPRPALLELPATIWRVLTRAFKAKDLASRLRTASRNIETKLL